MAAGAVALLALAGCNDRSEFKGGSALPTRLGDSQPSSGVNLALRMPVQGIDVSSHDGDIDWGAVKRSGISFAYLKTTEGGDFSDPKFMDNWKEAEAAGITRGAYHFMYWCRDADQQALFFMVNIPNDPDALPPVLDLEYPDPGSSCDVDLPPEKALPMIKTLLRAMQARTGKTPIIYTDTNFYHDVISHGDFSGYSFWLRSTAATPQKLYPGQGYTYWQFSGTGRVPGIYGEVDRNVFNGDAGDWNSFLVKTGVIPPPSKTTTASVTTVAGTVATASVAEAMPPVPHLAPPG